MQGRNCSCLSEPQSYQYDSRCNVLCLWENSQCKTSEAFSVFQQGNNYSYTHVHILRYNCCVCLQVMLFKPYDAHFVTSCGYEVCDYCRKKE